VKRTSSGPYGRRPSPRQSTTGSAPRPQNPASTDGPRAESIRPEAPRPQAERPQFDRPREDRPREDRPRDERPREERPRDDRPRDDRPRDDRPRGDRDPRRTDARPGDPRRERGPRPDAPPRDGNRHPNRPPQRAAAPGGPNAQQGGGRRQSRRRGGRPGGPVGPNDARVIDNPRNGRDPRTAANASRPAYASGSGGGGNGYRGGERSRYYGGDSRGYAPRRTRERRDIPFTDLLKELQQQVSVDPTERLRLETTPDVVSMRALEMIAPIGKGQRCLITAPPKAGKTTLLQEIAVALSKNHPEVEVVVLLVDERPEEVTHFRRSVPCEVLAASSDQTASEHVEIAERALAQVLVPVLEGKDVVVLLDSITRLARAYNTNFQGIGRTLSGGLDATTMQVPRQIFGAARNIENGGSLTILGTALIDTGSRMDEVIFQEFKGTGNMELVLSRSLFEKRVFPCIDIKQSGTRKEEKLYGVDEMRALHALRRRLVDRDPETAMLELLELLRMYPSNEVLLSKLM